MLDFKFADMTIEKKTKKSLIVSHLVFRDANRELCSTNAYIDLFFADAWKSLQAQTGLVRDFEYYDHLGQQLLKN